MSNTLFINPTALEAGLQAAFSARNKSDERHAAAFERFARAGLPNRRIEGWKWSDFNASVRALDPVEAFASDAVIAPSAFAGLKPFEIQIVNGRVVISDDERPEGLRCGVMDAMATIPELEAHGIVSLNVAMNRKALGLTVEEGVSLARPILIRHINDGAGFSFAQTLIKVDCNAKAQIIETYEGEGAGFYSHLNHMAVRDGASLQRYVMQETGASNIVHAMCAAKVDAEASFDQTSFSSGSALSRHETLVHFWGKDAEASINSAALVGDGRHSDFTSHVVFKEENCVTRQLHKGVAAGRGRNVFQGKFEVERKAQKTDAQMTANALLLSDVAEANHKPELEIYADDVECAHGSTAGALDEDALFYMRQRGLNDREARALLIEAFAGEVVGEITDEGVEAVFRAKVNEWLEAQ